MIIIIIITIITLLLYQLQYYSHCDYKFWQYNAKYAYHADKLSCSHSCWLETFGISFNVNSRRVEGGGGGGGLACPHPSSLPPLQPCFSTQNWSSGNVKILLNTSCSIQGARFLPSDDSRIAPWSRIVLAFVWTTAYLCIPGQLSINWGFYGHC